VTYSWTLRGQRKRLPYENPQGRRVNVLAALKVSSQPELVWDAFRRTLKAPDLLDFLQSLARPDGKPVIVVLDNASMHKNKAVQAARAALWQAGIYLYYLPPYSPDLNRIERIFRVIKHQGLPKRTYRTYDELEEAIYAAFAGDSYTLRTYGESPPEPGRAA